MNIGDINDSFDPDRNPEIDPVLWEIRRERLIELMDEGFSWPDIRRWKQGPWYVNKQHYGAYVEDAEASGITSQSLGETGILVEGGTTEASAFQLASQGGGGHLILLCIAYVKHRVAGQVLPVSDFYNRPATES